MQSPYRDDFFQTTTSIKESCRKEKKSGNKNGNPIKLPGKVLAIAADPFKASSVFVAESSGVLRAVALEGGETTAIYKGPSAPLTSLCFSTDGTTVFAGCWDKTIWSWHVKTRNPGHNYVGHVDFVKTVLCSEFNNMTLLVSGGADAKIIIWDLHNGAQLHVLQCHSRGIQSLAIDPITHDIFSAGSDRAILGFAIRPDSKDLTVFDPILEHQTSIYKLFFDDDGDLWTASADNTAKCLTKSSAWTASLTLEHPDFVKDVVVHEAGGWVITACRDEEVRIWDRAVSELPLFYIKSCVLILGIKTGTLHHTYSGHFEEVTGLLLLGLKIVSISIDGTIRQWSIHPQDLLRAKIDLSNDALTRTAERSYGLLTEEEERELADLLDQD
ncbi:hypothetical protein LOZ58_006842 [Ophidiomyces ophidiicola]|nr:hypothetical protein LOZ66_006703 [Ophidiomyces ophidiicola]KAI1955157.1 hypothetical protein LOZ58_006842 [Ophidiomyces ophidiicola]